MNVNPKVTEFAGELLTNLEGDDAGEDQEWDLACVIQQAIDGWFNEGVSQVNWAITTKEAIKPTHEAADAFWKYWRENGETHKHGYYESTWGAINAALNAPTSDRAGVTK